VEKAKQVVERVNNFVEELGVFLLEEGSLKLVVCYRFRLGVCRLTLSVDSVWVLDDNIQPNIRFNLLCEMRVLESGDTLYWV